MTIERATQVLDDGFDQFDTAAKGGTPDGKVSEEDLQAVAANAKNTYTPEQQQAAQFLLDSKASRNFLDKAAGKGWGLDGVIGRDDVTAARAAIADGSYTHKMLDTASTGTGWFAGPDGRVSQQDIDAALNDPGIPQTVKDAINLARAGDPNADLSFLNGLTADQAKAASELFQSADYKALSSSEKATVAQAWRNAQGDVAAVRDVQQLLLSPAFKAAATDLRADLLRGVALVHSDAFKALPAADQQLVRDTLAARKPGDTQLAQKLSDLMHSDSFKNLSSDEKTAVLSQARNYPTSAVVGNLGRLLDKGWFQGMSLEDKQRSLKTIAYMTDYGRGDRTILDNTLNKLLDPKLNFSLEWKTQKAGVGAYYTTGTGRVTMNLSDVPADNQPVGSASIWQIVNAVPHEINHAIEDLGSTPTFAYLEKEYQAYYTGNQAQNGRPMTRNEAVERWRDTLLKTPGIYGEAASGALADPVEAAKIFAYLSQLTGVAVNAGNYTAVLADPSSWNPPYDASKGPDIAVPAGAIPRGNTDNR